MLSIVHPVPSELIALKPTAFDRSMYDVCCEGDFNTSHDYARFIILHLVVVGLAQIITLCMYVRACVAVQNAQGRMCARSI